MVGRLKYIEDSSETENIITKEKRRKDFKVKKKT